MISIGVFVVEVLIVIVLDTVDVLKLAVDVEDKRVVCVVVVGALF